MKVGWPHVALVIVCFLWLRSCNEKRNIETAMTSNMIALKDEISLYKTKLGENAATRLALQGEKKTLELFLLDSRDSTKQMERLVSNYKNISAAVKTETITEIKEIEVPFIVPGVSFNIPFSKNEKYYRLSGRSTNIGLFIDSLSIPNTQSLVIGDKRTGFFKKEFRVDVVNSNPYIMTTAVSGYTYAEPIKRFGVGFFAGYGVGDSGFGPVIGFGVFYNLFQF